MVWPSHGRWFRASTRVKPPNLLLSGGPQVRILPRAPSSPAGAQADAPRCARRMVVCTHCGPAGHAGLPPAAPARASGVMPIVALRRAHLAPGLCHRARPRRAHPESRAGEVVAGDTGGHCGPAARTARLVSAAPAGLPRRSPLVVCRVRFPVLALMSGTCQRCGADSESSHDNSEQSLHLSTKPRIASVNGAAPATNCRSSLSDVAISLPRGRPASRRRS